MTPAAATHPIPPGILRRRAKCGLTGPLCTETIRCPECGAETGFSIDSRMSRDGREIRRRRQCSAGNRFTTYETFGEPVAEFVGTYEI